MAKKGTRQTNNTTSKRRSSVTPHDTVHPKKQVIRSWKDLQQDTIDDIHKTVRQLPLDNVLPLLKELLDAFDKDATARDTTEWLKIVLLTHTAYFMSLPDIVQRLSNVYKELEDRLTVYPKLLAMHGRLDLVQNQVDARHRKENESEDESETEEDEDDELQHYSESEVEEDDDIDGEDEDDEDDEDNLMDMDGTENAMFNEEDEEEDLTEDEDDSSDNSDLE
ncbi:uncharacterized protein B0P05DRAFT_564208 [Gilbertella persicaria]|uniref:uncharacterized protein n=1 Tax=Gilbertella persicaria TaxID=101096 RepID=UPI002220E7F1|nr:uncharacterized protein B0P05DRAFT_564208 [Gilbertella persicaria]KAI8048753.1 hypothetical protein B0P05DRAFT_564208 [Gilbertella persicaria]